jgi:trimeric autotransporter adhesin
MTRRIMAGWLITGVALLAGDHAAEACHDGSPLILDLNGDGVRTVDENHAVWFDIDADGVLDKVNWTFWESEEGFLVLDRNGNRKVDDGSELFGDATPLPSGGRAENGFVALAAYDQPSLGGNGDGVITSRDAVWPKLRIWIDSNQDGISQPREMGPLARFGIVGLGLSAVQSDDLDGNGNHHRLKGHYLRRIADHGAVELQELDMHDVFFRIIHQN